MGLQSKLPAMVPMGNVEKLFKLPGRQSFSVELQQGHNMQKEDQKFKEIIVISQFLVVPGYRSFFEHLARSHSRRRLSLIVPSSFRELGHQLVRCEDLRPEAPSNLRMQILRVFAPHVQIMILLGLVGVFRSAKQRSEGYQQLIIAMVEPYSFSFLWIWICLKLSGLKCEIWAFTFQNIYKSFRWPLSWIQRLCFQKASIILVGGAEHEEVLRRQGYSGKTVSFPLWYDESRFFLRRTSKNKSDRVRVGFCGKIASEKGVFDFLEALSINEAELRNRIQICIAGSGPDRHEVEDYLSRLRRQGWLIDDQGALGFEDIPAYFDVLDLLVVPSRTLGNWKEQFGRVIVEAMACGVTVLGSNSGEIPHVIGNPERIFLEGDPGSLAACLQKNLDPNLLDRQENNRLAFERYSSLATARTFSEHLFSRFASDPT